MRSRRILLSRIGAFMTLLTTAPALTLPVPRRSTLWLIALVFPMVLAPIWCVLFGVALGELGTVSGSILICLITVCCLTDLTHRKIYNWVTYSATLWAIGLNYGAQFVDPTLRNTLGGNRTQTEYLRRNRLFRDDVVCLFARPWGSRRCEVSYRHWRTDWDRTRNPGHRLQLYSGGCGDPRVEYLASRTAGTNGRDGQTPGLDAAPVVDPAPDRNRQDVVEQADSVGGFLCNWNPVGCVGCFPRHEMNYRMQRPRNGSASLELVMATAVAVPLAGAMLFFGFSICRYVFNALCGLLLLPFL